MSQDRVFYTKDWTREVDGVFVRALCQQTVEHNLVIHGAPNRYSIQYGRLKVNMQFRQYFDYDFCLDRFNKLYKQFKVFNWIIKQCGVVHYPIDNSLECDDEAWNTICRHDALGLAYMRRGEEEYENLKFIFTAAHESDSGEEDREVINLSSDPDGVSFSGDDTEDGANNAFSYELAWHSSPFRSDDGSSSFSSFSGQSSNVRKPDGKKITTKRPPVPRIPTGSGPSSVASNRPLNKDDKTKLFAIPTNL